MTWKEIIKKIWKLKRVIILMIIGTILGTIWGISIVLWELLLYGEIRYNTDLEIK